MAYCTLDSNNNITGMFFMPQPHLDGFAVIADDDARIAAFQAAQQAAMNPPPPTKEQLLAQITALTAQVNAL